MGSLGHPPLIGQATDLQLDQCLSGGRTGVNSSGIDRRPCPCPLLLPPALPPPIRSRIYQDQGGSQGRPSPCGLSGRWWEYNFLCTSDFSLISRLQSVLCSLCLGASALWGRRFRRARGRMAAVRHVLRLSTDRIPRPGPAPLVRPLVHPSRRLRLRALHTLSATSRGWCFCPGFSF